MKEREAGIMGGLLVLLLVLWLGFVFHASPRFPGSLWGGVLGVSGALLMLWPLAYSAVKRIPLFKKWVTKRVSMSTLLAWHVYTGILGAILAILHASHKFDSALGISLTSAMLVAVLTGFIGRYFRNLCSQELREQQDMLAKLQACYRQTAGELVVHPDPMLAYGQSRTLAGCLLLSLFVPETETGNLAVSSRAFRLAESIADLEYAIKTHELLKRRSAIWLELHIIASVTFYILLALHIWAAIYFGLRWFG